MTQSGRSTLVAGPAMRERVLQRTRDATRAMTRSEIRCATCGARNRLPLSATGRPRCGKCHADLAWLTNATGSDFDAMIGTSPVPVLVDLWAPWCGPCKTIAPILEQLALRRAGKLRVVKVDVDQSPEVSAQLGVQGIPTMVLFDDGVEVSRRVGAMPAHALEAWLDTVLTSATA